MANHDLAAELQGYRNELANVVAHGKDERAGAVREEITRVEGEVREVAEEYESKAEDHDAAGQDVLAAEARVEARRYRDLLPSEEESKPAETAPAKPGPAKPGPGRPRKENTADKTPKEKA